MIRSALGRFFFFGGVPYRQSIPNGMQMARGNSFATDRASLTGCSDPGKASRREALSVGLDCEIIFNEDRQLIHLFP